MDLLMKDGLIFDPSFEPGEPRDMTLWIKNGRIQGWLNKSRDIEQIEKSGKVHVLNAKGKPSSRG